MSRTGGRGPRSRAANPNGDGNPTGELAPSIWIYSARGADLANPGTCLIEWDEDRWHAAALAQALMRLPCGAIPEWVVPRRDSVRAFGVYATWDGIKDHPDLVELDRGDG